MALPKSIGQSNHKDAPPAPAVQQDENALDFEDVFSIQKPSIALIDDVEEDQDVQAISDAVKAGEFVPSWKEAEVPSAKAAPKVAVSSYQGSYKAIGALTPEEVINTPYEAYRHLEDAVADITMFVQEQLKANDKLADVEQARNGNTKAHEEMTRYLDQMILNHMTRNPITKPDDIRIVVAMVTNDILGLGPIEPLWKDPAISEIMINGPFDVRIEKFGKMIQTKGVKFRSQEHLLEVAQRILGEIGRHIDVQHPLEDGRLRDMSRINVVHPAVAPGGPYLTIRRFPDTAFSVEKLVQMKSMTEEMAVIVGNLVYAGCSAVIVGGTGTGKTSMLNALSGCIPNDERIITIEDNLELRIHPDKDVLALEARPAASSGSGAVTIRDLVKNTLRMRPDRIIVGEVRDDSTYDMLQAMNTGHDGSLTTVHADDAIGAVERLRNLVDQAGSFNASTALTLIAGGVDLFVVIGRYEDGTRRVAGVYEVPRTIEHLDNGDIRLTPIPLWEFVHDYTDEDEKVVGHYEKRNDISEALIQRKRLDKRKTLTLEEIYEISKTVDPVSNKEA